MGQDHGDPRHEDFRTTPEFAALLDQLVEATQVGDTRAVERILDVYPSWRPALEEERAFLVHIEDTRPAPPAAMSHETTVPEAVYALPMPLAQAWLATLDAATTPARLEAAHFAVESYTVYLTAVAVGAYDLTGEEDEEVATSLARLGQNGRPHVWLETMDTLVRWSTASPRPTPPRTEVPGRIHRHLDQPVASPEIEELVVWLNRLHGGGTTGTATGTVTVRTFLESVLAHHQATALRPGALVRGADAERTAERLEAALGSFLTHDALLPRLPCVYVRSVERIGKNLFQHGLVDLKGTSPLTRRGGLLLPGLELEPGRVYCLAFEETRPLPLHPFFIFQEGKALRLSPHQGRQGFSYSACMAGEGRIDRAVRPGGVSRIEALLLPRKSGRPPAEGLLTPGMKEVIGDFHILRQIGEGGMALVFLAEQRSIGREVALKVLHKNRLSSGFVERFRREGKAIGRLEHPHIVKVHAVGEEDGIPYLAMEYVHGESLEKHLRVEPGEEPRLPRALGERSPMESVCRVAREVALALDHAHTNGIVHRDVKPGNILLDEDGHAHLTDFGLAQEQGKASLTVTGDMVGTPHFLSPEQVAAKRIEIDHRTDIYSLGVTLYQMLTGTLPFTGETLEQILRQIALKEPTPPRKLNPRVPRDLETICLHAMEKDPDARYASAAEMAEDLQAVTELRPILASRIGPARRAWKLARRRPAVTLLAILLGGALAVWGLSAWHRHARDATRIQDSLRLGRAMVDVGREGRALPYFQRVLELSPDHPEAHEQVNRIRFLLDLERAAELAFDWDDPRDDGPARRCLDLLARLRRLRRDARQVDLLEAHVRVRLGREETARQQEALAFIESLADWQKSPGLRLLRDVALAAGPGSDTPAPAPRLDDMTVQDDQDRMVLALAFMAQEKWKEALTLYSEVLRRGRREFELTAASQAARCCFRLKDYDGALEHLRLLEREHGRKPTLLRRRALYLWGAGELELALNALDEALERQPDYVLALNTRGHILNQARRFEEALASLDEAVRRAPDLALAYATRSQVHANLGHFEAALRDIDEAIQRRPDLTQALLARARILNKQGSLFQRERRHRQARESWRKALHDLGILLEHRPQAARALAERALIYQKTGDLRFAREDAERALKLQPDLAAALYALGVIHYGEGDLVQAAENLEEALTLEPDLPGALSVRAHLHSLAGRYEEALEDLARVIALEPHYVQARVNRAAVFVEQKRWDEAQAEAEAALKRQPMAEAYIPLYQVHLQRDHDLDAAHDDLIHALALNPELPGVHFYLGELHRTRALEKRDPSGPALARAYAHYAECVALCDRWNEPIRDEAEAQRVNTKKRAARALLEGDPPDSLLARALRGFGRVLRDDRPGARADLDAGVKALSPADPCPPRTVERYYPEKHGLLLLADLAGRLDEISLRDRLYRRYLQDFDPEDKSVRKRVGGR